MATNQEKGKTMETTSDTFTVELDTNAEEEYEYEDAMFVLDFYFSKSPVEYFRIEGRNMGWQHQGGHIVVPSNKVVEALTLNGDYRIVITLPNEGDITEFTAVRYSHDEPCGASFTARPATEDEVEESRY